MRVEKVEFDSDGVKLRGELFLPKSKVPSPALIICHGFDRRGYKGYSLFEELARSACEEGFVALVFDFRGCGESEGEFGYGWDEQKDLKAAIDFVLSRKEAQTDSVLVVGHSLGGAVALYVAEKDKRVKCIALWSTPHDHAYNLKRFIMRARGRLGYYVFMMISYVDAIVNVSRFFSWRVYGIMLRPRDLRTRLMKLKESEVLKRLDGVSILIVNGSRDQLAPLEEARINYEAAKEPKELVIIESVRSVFKDREQEAIASHVFHGKERETIQKTVAWLKRMAT